MELEILRENLNQALGIVTRVLATRAQVPILSNVLLDNSSGHLTITASNLETTICTRVGAKNVSQGRFTVPGRLFLETVTSLTSAEKISLKTSEGKLIIKAGKSASQINGISAEEYPVTVKVQDNPKNEPFWEVDWSGFAQIINQITFAAGTDASRAVLTGVYFRKEKDVFSLAATDGFRLSVVNLPVTKKKDLDLIKVIIPSKTLTEVSRIISDKKAVKTDKPLKIFCFEDSGQIFFDLDDIQIYSRVISGSYPDFEKIIPTNSAIKIVASTEELSANLRLAAVFARESSDIVKFKINDQKLTIGAQASQSGGNESEVSVQIEGKGSEEELIIAFNYRYLLDFLNSSSGAEVSMELSGPLSPGIFRFSKNKDYLHIIMPVRVQG